MKSNRVSGMLGSLERKKAGLMRDDVVDYLGERALNAMKQAILALFGDWYFDKAFSQGFGAKVKYAKSAANLDGTVVGFPRGTKTSRITELGCNPHRLKSKKAALGLVFHESSEPRINSPSMSEA